MGLFELQLNRKKSKAELQKLFAHFRLHNDETYVTVSESQK